MIPVEEAPRMLAAEEYLMLAMDAAERGGLEVGGRYAVSAPVAAAVFF